ncbi:TniB family NTP-binding protein [Pseudomonas moorei]|uniref:TniB family NTP-binding protein n=1 Tax=Pseudomonas moorei TaxID=395599 RepID=UPI001FF14313|nr:TniB family NTP-binding protein [Pseudomonas moorei]
MSPEIQNKLTDFSKHIVAHGYYKDAVDQILKSIHTTAARREPASTLLTGPSGVGKSTACKYVMQKIGAKQEIETEWGIVQTVPAFYCGLPAGTTLKSLTISMLAQLGCNQLNGDATTLLYRLMTLLKTCKTQVILLDEFDHLLAKGAEKTKILVCNWVKTLMNETLIPVVLAGMPECQSIVDEHPQLARRYPFRANLRPLEFASNDSQSDYLKTLKSLGAQINRIGAFSDSIYLTDQTISARIYAATGGNMNSLRQLLHEAFSLALTRNIGVFSEQDLANSYGCQILEGSLIKHGNPFTMAPQEIRSIISRSVR